MRIEVPFANQLGQGTVTQNSREVLVAPTFASDDIADGPLIDAKLFRHLTLSDGSCKTPNLRYVVFGQFCHIVPLAPVVGAVRDLIAFVFRVSGPSQVLGIAAKLISAGVGDLVSDAWRWSMPSLTNDNVGPLHFAAKPDMTVAVGVGAKRPF